MVIDMDLSVHTSHCGIISTNEDLQSRDFHQTLDVIGDVKRILCKTEGLSQQNNFL